MQMESTVCCPAVYCKPKTVAVIFLVVGVTVKQINRGCSTMKYNFLFIVPLLLRIVFGLSLTMRALYV